MSYYDEEIDTQDRVSALEAEIAELKKDRPKPPAKVERDEHGRPTSESLKAFAAEMDPNKLSRDEFWQRVRENGLVRE